MKLLSQITMAIVLLPLLVQGQQNLVPNGDFEELLSCPDNMGQWYYTTNWNSANNASPDYFHVCGPPQILLPADTFPFLGVPDNLFGHQLPHSGDAYMGLYAMQLPDIDLRDYIQAQLTDSIIYGVRYKVSFHASLTGEYSRYAISTLGAHLSTEPLSSNSFSVFDVEPQILNDPLYPLTDTIDWILITDTFVSRTGGERFITIGNFHRDVDSDTLFFNPVPPSGNRCAYYYIDDVSVIALDSIPNGVEEYGGLRFTVFPNPATDMVRIETRHDLGSVRLSDMLGREVYGRAAQGRSHTLDLRHLPTGIYLLQVTDLQGHTSSQRVVKAAEP
ncbi:MAG: T9SS type A sorting domain-containing protein [Flavobacteriales bacterium]|nr:T9SS type A sorting domain-containing protein [Flavobacteriales bacterium]